ncbi:hypothetical protein [Mycobacteroides abscessus]|uniref:hypothetical protein n=1 Tax=Mycobacteroides abscessus TaxID=36809 RepID=UPI0002E09942|nr:hypothetical protein [Mycobacteroides abscessus]
MSRQSGPAEADDDAAIFVRGPGRRRRSTSEAVYEAYTGTGAINRPCTGCGAEPLDCCRTPEGRPRKIPCLQRLSERQES